MAARKPRRTTSHAPVVVSSAGGSTYDTLLGPLLLVALFFVYWPAMHGTLLWDDAGHITAPSLRSLWGLWRIWTEPGATQQYYPLLHSAFWLEWHLWGTSVTGYHVLNVLLHYTSSLLVFLLCRRLSIPGAWIVAWIFALHPVQVESVAWISEQKNTLSTVFYLAAAWYYLSFARTGRRREYAIASILFGCALLTKTTTATLPAALLLVLWWKGEPLANHARTLGAWLVAGVAAGVATAMAERYLIGAKGEAFAFGFGERVVVAGRVVAFYLGTLIWPAHLSFNYERWNLADLRPVHYLAPISVAIVLVFLWSIRKRTRAPLTAGLFFVGTLVPVLGFLNVYPFVYSFVADHFQYVASIGMFAFVVGACAHVTSSPRRRRAGIACAVVVIAALGLVTRGYAATYRDAETLYRSTIAANPESWFAHLNLGVELVDRPGGLAEATRHFRTAVDLHPTSALANRNLANALVKAGADREAAAGAYRRALASEPNVAADHLNLGGLLLADRSTAAEGIAHIRTAIELDPLSAPASYMLGLALQRTDAAGAEQAYRQAIALDGTFVPAHMNLGTLLAARDGGSAEAAREYRAVIALDSRSADAHFNLANVLMEDPSTTSEAAEHFERALALRPGFAAAHTNFALLLLRLPGREGEAVAHLEAALRADPSYQPARQLLANVQSR